MPELPRAAHVDHTIAHSYADIGDFIGGGLGLVIGLGIAIGSGGTATAAGVAVFGIGRWLGAKISGLFGEDENSGVIARGSPTVHYGPQKKNAARMNDRTACGSPGMAGQEMAHQTSPLGLIVAVRGFSRWLQRRRMRARGEELLPSDYAPGGHPGSKIADGSSTVFIETWPAARKGDGVAPCAGKISSGISSIRIGGDPCSLQDTETRSELNPGQDWFFWGVDVAGNIYGGFLRDPGAFLSLASTAADALGFERLALAINTVQLGRGFRKFGELGSTDDLVRDGLGNLRRADRYRDRVRRYVDSPPPRRVFIPGNGGRVITVP